MTVSDRKVLYVHSGGDVIGGIETFIEASLPRHRRYEAHVAFVRDGRFARRVREGFERTVVLDGGRLRQLHRTVRVVRDLARLARRGGFDLILGQGTHSWVYAGLAARWSGVPGVYYVHGIPSRAEIGLGSPIGFAAAKIPPALFIANSQATAEGVKSMLRPRCAVETVYPAAEFRRFETARGEAVRHELGIGEGEPVIALLGRIQPWKGQEYLVRAAPSILRGFPKARFLFVGDPTFERDRAYLRHLEGLANDLGVAGSVRFLGFRADTPELLAASDIVVHASVEPEPFGLVIVEGMAAGKPVIATDAGGPREIIADGVDGFLIPPRDPEAIARTAVALLRDPSLRRTVGDRARRTVPERLR